MIIIITYSDTLFTAAVIPAQAGIQSYPHGNLSGKKVSSIPHPGFPPARE